MDESAQLSSMPQVMSGGHQARLTENTPWFNGNRDVAHNIPKVVELVARRFDQRRWPSLEKLLQREGVTDDELAAALQAYVAAIARIRENPREDWFSLLDRHRWFAAPVAAQVAVMATLGCIYAGMAFQGVREATIEGKGPALTSPELMQATAAACETLLTPKWRRPWMRLQRFLRRIKNAIRQPAP